jgi:hypothetical protein
MLKRKKSTEQALLDELARTIACKEKASATQLSSKDKDNEKAKTPKASQQ